MDTGQAMTRRLGAACVCLGLLVPATGHAAIEAYNPVDDPNYRAAQRAAPVDGARVAQLAEEFQRARPGAAVPAAAAAPTPASPASAPVSAGYAASQAVDSGMANAPYYAAPAYGVPYGYSNWGASFAFRTQSPRIPWWSLLPRRDREGRFTFRRHDGPEH